MSTRRLHETADIDAGRVGRVGAIASAVFLLCLLASFALWVWWLKPPANSLISPAAPQPPPQAELLRNAQQGRLQEYGWVDEAGGIARIPVERAMELLISTAGSDTGKNGQPEQQQDVPRPQP